MTDAQYLRETAKSDYLLYFAKKRLLAIASRIEAAERDAKRYRHLRENYAAAGFSSRAVSWELPVSGLFFSREQFDNSVDAAMKAKP